MDSGDMFILDENSAQLGVDKRTLMENAGNAIARFINDAFGPASRRNVVIFCGLGNNGGDGFVAARHLAGFGHVVHVVVAGDPRHIATPEASANWTALENCPWSIRRTVIHDSTAVRDLPNPGDDAIIVDALLGSGIKGAVRQPVAACIDHMNTLREGFNVPVIAVDVPSGMNMDDGSVASVFNRATHTITFHLPKVGFTSKDGITGKVHIEPIGIPPEAGWIIGRGDVKALFKHQRGVESTKGMNGKVVVIGGSKQYSGAPVLAALAALKCGVDLVQLCVPEHVAVAARSISPDLIVTGLPGDDISLSSEEAMQARVDWADTVLIGPGAGRTDEVTETIRHLCGHASKAKKNLVIDADALKAIAGHLEDVNTGRTVITPHAGELAALAGLNPAAVKSMENKLDVLQTLLKESKITCIVKGHQDIVATTHELKINLTGSPAMTAGGTGDVLAGITAGFSALFSKTSASQFKIAAAAVHVNGLLGERAERTQGGPFITASMLLDHVGEVLSTFR